MSIARSIAHITGLAGRAFRVFGYSFFLGIGAIVRLGIEKLVLVPEMLAQFGEVRMGFFLYLLGWTNLFGLFQSGSTVEALLRLNVAARKEDRWEALVINGVVFNAVLGTLGLLIAGGIVAFTAEPVEGVHLWSVTLVLSLAVLFTSTRIVLSALLRISLKLKRIALVELSAGVALLMAWPLAAIGGITGLAAGFALSALVGQIIQLAMVWPMLRGKRFTLRRQWLIRLAKAVVVFIIGSASGMAYAMSGRIALGLRGVYGDVSSYYAAETTVLLLLAPLNFVASGVYTIVVRKASIAEISKQARVQHVVVAIVCSVGMGLLTLLVGEFVIKARFDEVRDAALVILRVLTVSAAAQALFSFVRGFVVRFYPMRVFLTFSVTQLVLMVITLSILTPLFGVMGVAYAVASANAIKAIVWFGAYLRLLIRADRVQPQASTPQPLEQIDG